jgi:hypothetical protein
MNRYTREPTANHKTFLISFVNDVFSTKLWSLSK